MKHGFYRWSSSSSSFSVLDELCFEQKDENEDEED
jgi:hypothetical protein